MPKKDTPDASPVARFEHSLDELEQLVEKMEQGEMSLEDSLAAYERGVGLYRRCQAALEQAELRVRLLTDPDQPDNAQGGVAHGRMQAHRLDRRIRQQAFQAGFGARGPARQGLTRHRGWRRPGRCRAGPDR